MRRDVQRYFIAVIKSLLGRRKRSAIARADRNGELLFLAYDRNHDVGRNIFKRERVVFQEIFDLAYVRRGCLVAFFRNGSNGYRSASRHFGTRQNDVFYSLVADSPHGIFRAIDFGSDGNIAVDSYFVLVFVLLCDIFAVDFKRYKFAVRGKFYENFNLFTVNTARFIRGDRSERVRLR